MATKKQTRAGKALSRPSREATAIAARVNKLPARVREQIVRVVDAAIDFRPGGPREVPPPAAPDASIPIALSTAISACFEQIGEALPIVDTPYVALEKASDGDDSISITKALTTMRIGREHMDTLQSALDHLSMGGATHVEKALMLLNGVSS